MIARFDAYLFDLDGTIYLGDDLLPGARETISWLRAEGVPFRFLSNNATKSPAQYAEKLTALGLPTDPDEVVNTVTVTTHWLRTQHREAVVFPIAERPLIEALAAAGIAMSEDPAEIDIVVASYDRGFEYRKLQIAFDAIWFHKRAFLVATNPDRYCPFPGGRGEPDCAAVVAAIEACTGTTCRAVLGKPEPAMAEAALAGLHVDPTRVVMVGDRLGTDIELAHRAGLNSALVLTGDSSKADVEAAALDRRPGLVLERIDELIC